MPQRLPPLTLTQRILREPLFHFTVLAALIFLADHAFSALQKEKIMVDRQTARYLIQQRENMELRELSAAERRETIDSYVKDEILYSEAYKRGLDRGDTRMRRNLILKMRGLLTDEVEEPSEQQLRSHFEQNRAFYAYPANRSLDQLFFSDPSQVPKGLLEQIQSGRDISGLGDFLPDLGRRLPRRSRTDLARLFGPDAARTILAIQDDRWHGPIESTRGVHFVRITGREPARDADFEHIKAYLEKDWIMAQARLVVEQEIKRLSEDYEVVIDDFDREQE